MLLLPQKAGFLYLPNEFYCSKLYGGKILVI